MIQAFRTTRTSSMLGPGRVRAATLAKERSMRPARGDHRTSPRRRRILGFSVRTATSPTPISGPLTWAGSEAGSGPDRCEPFMFCRPTTTPFTGVSGQSLSARGGGDPERRSISDYQPLGYGGVSFTRNTPQFPSSRDRFRTGVMIKTWGGRSRSLLIRSFSR